MGGFRAQDPGNLQTEPGKDGLVRDDARTNFKFFYDPKDWQVNAAGDLVPVIVHVGKEPGHGSVTPKGGFAQMEAELVQHGKVAIPHDVLGGDQDYVAMYRNERGRKVHRSIFQMPDHGDDGQTVWRHDERAWGKFLRFLRKEGIIKQPSVGVVKGVLNTKEHLRADKVRRGPRNATAEAKLQFDREISQLDATILMLRKELAESERVYGPDEAPVHDLLDGLLDDLDDEPAEAAPPERSGIRAELSDSDEIVPTATRTRGRGRGPKLERPAGDREAAEVEVQEDDS